MFNAEPTVLAPAAVIFVLLLLCVVVYVRSNRAFVSHVLAAARYAEAGALISVSAVTLTVRSTGVRQPALRFEAHETALISPNSLRQWSMTVPMSTSRLEEAERGLQERGVLEVGKGLRRVRVWPASETGPAKLQVGTGVSGATFTGGARPQGAASLVRVLTSLRQHIDAQASMDRAEV